MGRSRSSRRWLDEHFRDPYVQRAQAEGLRSRAAFKLQEIQERHALVRAGQLVVDLGAAPGGWSQLLQRWVGASGTVLALDLLPLEPLEGVECLQGDFTENEVLAALEDRLGARRADVVLSDMAPNISGMSAVDQPRAMYLAELAVDFARQWNAPGGDLLVKVFQGEGFDALLADLRRGYRSVKVVKPAASRPRSREVYFLARGFHGPSC